MQEFTAPLNATYKIECWGAQGGSYYNKINMVDGGKGGFSIGYKNLNMSDELYICVGSKGSDNSGTSGGNGGYNGGGNGGDGYGNYSGGGGGGGATHIAIISNRGLLKNYKDNYQSEILLVSGGGGGTGAVSSPGYGGGLNGGTVSSGHGVYTVIGATQTSGYVFGQGQNGKTKTNEIYWGVEGNGGGGGGFYGGLACQEDGANSDCGGAGGSGYVGDVTNGETIAGDQTFPKPKGGTETGHSGDGYAIITWQQLP